MPAEEGRAMTIDCAAITRELSPIPSFEDLSRRLRGAFGYAFVREAYDFTMPALADYTTRLLGGDTRQRYTDYATGLIATFRKLGAAGAPGIRALTDGIDTRAHFAAIAQEAEIAPGAFAAALKFLVYWVVPMARPLRALARPTAEVQQVIEKLRQAGLRTNLDALEVGRAPAGRRALAARSGAPVALVDELVQRGAVLRQREEQIVRAHAAKRRVRITRRREPIRVLRPSRGLSKGRPKPLLDDEVHDRTRHGRPFSVATRNHAATRWL